MEAQFIGVARSVDTHRSGLREGPSMRRFAVGPSPRRWGRTPGLHRRARSKDVFRSIRTALYGSIRRVTLLPNDEDKHDDIEKALAEFVGSGRMLGAICGDARLVRLWAFGWTAVDVQQSFSVDFIGRIRQRPWSGSHPGRYLKRALENYTTDLLRKGDRLRQVRIEYGANYASFEKPPQQPGDISPVTSDDSVEQLLDGAQTLLAIQRVAKRLSRQRARVLVLMVVERLDANEIAEQLGLALKTVKAHIRAISREIANELEGTEPSSSQGTSDEPT
jgi:DNA-directed RNA polymerase specialized sigma24 family protein